MAAWIDHDILRRSARLGLAGVMVLAAVRGAAAGGDAGVQEFFSSIFGGAAAQSPAVQAGQPTVQADQSAMEPMPQRRHRGPRPLTVRLHHAGPRIIATQGPVKTVKVSIFEDRTLKRGDAVMTAKGIRIFAGSASWPYTAEDFVAPSDARNLNKGTVKVFADLDRLPRG